MNDSNRPNGHSDTPTVTTAMWGGGSEPQSVRDAYDQQQRSR